MQNKTMTIQQVADTLGVTPEAIRKHIRDLYPNLMNHGRVTYLEQVDVARIKERMQQSTKVVSSKTEIEIMEGGLAYIQWLQSKIEEQKTQLTEAQPKIEFFDVVADAQGERTIMEAAKLLKIPKPRSLYETLRLRGVLSNDNIPYQRFILDGLFRVNLTEKNGRTYSTTYVTNKGLNWLQKKFAGAK